MAIRGQSRDIPCAETGDRCELMTEMAINIMTENLTEIIGWTTPNPTEIANYCDKSQYIYIYIYGCLFSKIYIFIGLVWHNVLKMNITSHHSFCDRTVAILLLVSNTIYSIGYWRMIYLAILRGMCREWRTKAKHSTGPGIQITCWTRITNYYWCKAQV